MLKENLTKDKEVCRLSAQALGEIGPEAKTAVPLLTDLLSVEDEELQIHVAEALLKISPKRTEAVDALLVWLKNKEQGKTRRRAHAAGVLATIERHRAIGVRVLTDMMESTDAGSRSLALGRLGEVPIDPSFRVPLLTSGLEYSDPFLRQLAAEYLGRMGPAAKESLNALMRIEKSDTDDFVRWQAADAIKRIKGVGKEVEKKKR